MWEGFVSPILILSSVGRNSLVGGLCKPDSPLKTIPLPPSSAYDTLAYTTAASPYTPDYPVQTPDDAVSPAPDTQDHSHTVPDAPPSDSPRIPGQSHTDLYHNPGSSIATPSDVLSVSPYMQGHFPAASEHIPAHMPDPSQYVSCRASPRYVSRRPFLRRPALLILALLLTTHRIILKSIFKSIESRRVRHTLSCQPLPDNSIEMHPRTSIRDPRKRFQPLPIRSPRLSLRPKDLYPKQFNILISDSLRRLDTRIKSFGAYSTPSLQTASSI